MLAGRTKDGSSWTEALCPYCPSRTTPQSWMQRPRWSAKTRKPTRLGVSKSSKHQRHECTFLAGQNILAQGRTATTEKTPRWHPPGALCPVSTSRDPHLLTKKVTRRGEVLRGVKNEGRKLFPPLPCPALPHHLPRTPTRKGSPPPAPLQRLG
jgi:hypothetical protein